MTRHPCLAVEQRWPDPFAERYRQAGFWRGETFAAVLRARTAAAPDDIAVVAGETRWRYRELAARAAATAGRFLDLGYRPGDRVIVQLPNIPEFLSVAFGLFEAGIVPVFALPAHRITEISHFAAAAEASGYVISGAADGFDYCGLADELCRRLPAIRHVVVAAGDPGRFVALTDRPGGTPAASAAPATGPQASEVALMQISGGSTGLPKLIPRSHDDYLYSVRASAEICRLDRRSVYLGVLPIAHNFPMSSPGVFGTLYAGGTVVLSPAPSPEIAFPIIARERVTMTAMVPPLALAWLEAARTGRHDLSSLRVLQVGGAKFTPEAARRVRPVLGTTLQQVFGMAEGLVNYTRLDDPEAVIVETQGRPISPDDELLIVDDDDQPVAEGSAGHLLTRGPYTIRAYHNHPAANARSFTAEGFYRTGDVVRRTPDGNLVVQGRSNDLINRGGEKLSAEEVEDHLLAHPQVHDAVMVAVPDRYLGERSCAFVIARGEPPKPADLRAWVRDRGLAEFKVPDRVVFVDSFLTTAVGKISRGDLRRRLAEQAAPSPPAHPAKG
ncbi:MAG: AMP-binding protein [Azospirillum sp.]|nr:AMP-binding protein [Azospirillum sp.]